MLVIRIGLLVVHITAAAFLFGGSAAIARPLRRTLDLGGRAFVIAAEDAFRRGRLLGISSLMTMMTGIGLTLLNYESFGRAPKNFHAALGLMFIGVAVSLLLLRPATREILRLSAAEPLVRPPVQKQLKRLSAGQGVMHLLWVLILVLMFVRF